MTATWRIDKWTKKIHIIRAEMEATTIANTIQSMVIQIMKATIILEIKVSASSRIQATKMSME